MFDTLSPAHRVRSRGRGIALTVALVLHAVAIGIAGTASLLAAEPIEPPSTPLVIYVALNPPPPPALPAARSAPSAPPAPRPDPPSRPDAPLQPREVPAQLPTNTTPAIGGEPGPGLPVGDPRGDPDGDPNGDPNGQIDGVIDGDPHAVLSSSQEEVLPVGGDVHAPLILSQVQPRYPEVAKAARAQGLVILEAIINTSGQVEDVKVLRGHPMLETAAIEAIQQWRFTPGTLNGRPVKVIFTLTVNFTLRS